MTCVKLKNVDSINSKSMLSMGSVDSKSYMDSKYCMQLQRIHEQYGFNEIMDSIDSVDFIESSP